MRKLRSRKLLKGLPGLLQRHLVARRALLLLAGSVCNSANVKQAFFKTSGGFSLPLRPLQSSSLGAWRTPIGSWLVPSKYFNSPDPSGRTTLNKNTEKRPWHIARPHHSRPSSVPTPLSFLCLINFNKWLSVDYCIKFKLKCLASKCSYNPAQSMKADIVLTKI